MNCEDLTAAVDDYLDGGCLPEQRERFEAHLDECADCAQRIARERVIRSALRALPVEGPSPGFADRAIAAAHARKRSRAARNGRIVAGTAALVLIALSAGIMFRIQSPAPTGDVVTLARAIEVTPAQPRTVNLVFASERALDGVSLILELPMGVELTGYPGLTEVRWTTSLNAGRNILPLELNATGAAAGDVVARLRHDGTETTFRIPIANAG